MNLLTGVPASGTHSLTIGSATGMGAIGVTAGGGITFTNVSGQTLAIVGGGGTINIGQDATNNTINVGCGTGVGTQTIAVGSNHSTSTTTIYGGTGVTHGVQISGGPLNIATAGQYLAIKGASFAATNFIGVGTLVLGTTNIANTNIAAGDVIIPTRTGVGLSTTLGELTYTISAGSGFTVTSVILGTPGSTQTGDLSTFSYIIVRPS